ncbi:MAG: NADH-quinone oxidoreductase subunit N [Acidobacteria bacterium]|nr:NADH-quinone oxidoreductase subunit N [Acidobacteriota bacterium]
MPTEFSTPDVDAWLILPLLVLIGGAVLLLMVASLVKSLQDGRFAAYATTAIAASAAICVIPLWARLNADGASSTFNGAVGFDGFSLFITVMICISVALTALVAAQYLIDEGFGGVEFYVLMLLSAAGGVVMASANDLIVLFLGLEVLSIAVYVLVASQLRRFASTEAGLKYFLLGAFSSAFLLYGIALVYGATGSTNMSTIKDFLAGNLLTNNALLLAGFALMLVGLGFKVAAVPFHAWTPDVYEGAPSPVVGFMASVVKAAGFAALIRVFVVTFSTYASDWQPAIYALAVLSLLGGSIAAVVQTNVKRMLAYSSISHAGFILVGVQAATDDGVRAALFYVAAYSVMIVGTFGVVTVFGGEGDHAHSLDDYRGLGRRRPALAFALTILLLSQAGVPFTVGFFAKLEIITAAVGAGSQWLGVIAMLAAVIAAYLYLRIVVSLFMQDADEEAEPVRLRTPDTAVAAIAIAVAAVMFFGIVPGPLDDVARDAVPVLVTRG